MFLPSIYHYDDGNSSNKLLYILDNESALSSGIYVADKIHGLLV